MFLAVLDSCAGTQTEACLHPSSTGHQEDSRGGTRKQGMGPSKGVCFNTCASRAYRLPARGTEPLGWQSWSGGCSGRSQCHSWSSRRCPSTHSHCHGLSRRHTSAPDVPQSSPMGQTGGEASEAHLGSVRGEQRAWGASNGTAGPQSLP